MKGGLDLLNVFSGALPEEELVKLLEMSISEWKEDRISENFKKMSMSCMLITIKDAQNRKGGGVEGMESLRSELQESQDLCDLNKRMKGN